HAFLVVCGRDCRGCVCHGCVPERGQCPEAVLCGDGLLPRLQLRLCPLLQELPLLPPLQLRLCPPLPQFPPLPPLQLPLCPLLQQLRLLPQLQLRLCPLLQRPLLRHQRRRRGRAGRLQLLLRPALGMGWTTLVALSGE